MKRFITMLVVPVATCALVLGATGAGASTSRAHKAEKTAAPATVTLTCTLKMTQQPADGEDIVLPADAGDYYGHVLCDKPGFGYGVIYDAFTVPDSGDTEGQYQMYFNGGSFTGALNLVPGGGDELSEASFNSQTWTGKMTVDGGNGLYKGVAAKKPGKFACASTDSVHVTCEGSLTLVVPALRIKPVSSTR